MEITQAKLGLYEQALLNIERGACLLKSDQPEQALRVLQLAIGVLDQNQNEMEQASARLWMAVALYEKKPEKAVDNLIEFLPAPRSWQKATPLMITAGRVVGWLKKRESPLLEDPFIADFFRYAEKTNQYLLKLRKRLRQTSARTPQLMEFEFYTFGSMRVVRNGYEIKLSDWQTREAKELFFFLLQSPPISKEKIGLVFWPDITPARLKMRFKINIYRIRQVLGQDSILFEGGRYRFNKALNYKWDRELFDVLILDARNSSDRLSLLNQALALVHGSYMADVDTNWATSDRYKYQEICYEAMVELAEAYLQEGQIAECLRLAKQILETDPFVEAGHRLLIQAYAALDDQANMTRYYREYIKILRNELGIEPSPNFISIYTGLMQKV